MQCKETFDVANMSVKTLNDPTFKSWAVRPDTWDGGIIPPECTGIEHIQHTQIFRTTFYIERKDVERWMFWSRAAKAFESHCKSIELCFMYSKKMDSEDWRGLPHRQMAGVTDMMEGGWWSYPMLYQVGALNGRLLKMRYPEGLLGVHSTGPWLKCDMLSELTLLAWPTAGKHGPLTSHNGTLRDMFESYRNAWGVIPKVVN